MTEPAYGIIINEQFAGPLPVQSGDFSVIGLLLPADDADATMFPLNTPVQFNSSDPTYLAKAGTSDFAKALASINNQLAAWQSAANVVAVLVARGGDLTATIANLVGDEAAGTGLYAFKRAGALTGFIPRLIASPGYTKTLTSTGGATTVTRAAKAGMVGGGALTLANPPSLSGAQDGVYKVVCIGGATSVASAAKAGMVGGGALGALTSAADAALGKWRAVCTAAAAGAGAFAVFNPAGGLDGVATVGVAYNSAHGPRFTISASGTDFAVGDEFDLTVVAAVPANGGVFAVTDPQGAFVANATVGAAFTDQIAFTIADGAPDFAIGDEFDVTVTISGGVAEANPLCAALPAVLNSLLAVAVVGAGDDGVVASTLAWRQTLASDRLIPADVWVIPGSGVGYADGVAEALGAQVAVDFEHGGIPGWSISGQQIQGIGGLKTYYSFSLTDGATQGQELLAEQVSVIEPGAIGSDTAIASSGYVWAGVWNASTDPRAWFTNKRRMKDYVNLALVKAIRLRLGVDNVTPHAVQAVLNDMVVLGSWLLSKQISIGFKVSFVPSQNSPSQLQQGQFVVAFANEVPAPITQVTVNSSDDPDALTVELATIIAQANTVAPQYLTN
ncbi:MAG: hypothetical protein ABSF67_02710 [Roseiarcus sp.]|jgi:hypothetical protein